MENKPVALRRIHRKFNAAFYGHYRSVLVRRCCINIFIFIIQNLCIYDIVSTISNKPTFKVMFLILWCIKHIYRKRLVRRRCICAENNLFSTK